MMLTKTTNVFLRNLDAFYNRKIRRAVNQGGTSSSKTFSIVQLLVFIALHTKNKTLLISIVSESVPHLKRGCMRDFYKIMGESFEDRRWNKTDSIYTFPSGAQIEFFSADNPSKLRGGRRDILYLNECNNIPYDAYMELDIRTRLFTFLDYNPVAEFWAHDKVIPYTENAYIHSTYLDAVNVLDVEVVRNIESNRDKDPNWWNVYGLGNVGKIEGLVYPHFSILEAMPTLASYNEIFGLDFGFSIDPTALVRNRVNQKNLYSEEIIYQRDMTNKAIVEKFEELEIKKNYDLIIADSNEPKSIEEIHGYGYNIIGVDKPPGSVEFGHQKVNQYKQFWLKSSTNCIKEQRNFMYIKDKNGNFTEKTTHFFSHGMDARRYAIMSIGDPGGYSIKNASKW
jgi:phage terminase large subunit